MSALVSGRIGALRQKVGQLDRGGQWVSAEDVAGFISELRAIGVAAQALEDRVAASSRGQAPAPSPRPVPPRPPIAPRPGAVPIGTIFFLPSGAAQ